MLSRCYTALYALGIIAFFPWGSFRGEIWTLPKVYVLVAIALLNLAVLLFGSKADAMPKIPLRWYTQLTLWLAFLAAGYVSVSLSPFPDRAWYGHDETYTGMPYWGIVAFTTLSNGRLLQAYPHLLTAQVRGVLLGGGLQALAGVPQLINWKLDYTITSGQTLPGFEDNILLSDVTRDYQPMGFFSHRGHSAIVLMEAALLAIVARRQHWISPRSFYVLGSLLSIMLLLSRTRAALLAGFLGLVLMLGWRYRRPLMLGFVSLVLAIGLITINRPIEGLPIISQITSDRVYLWNVATYGIQQRPLWGWGFDGFGLAYPSSNSKDWKPNVVDIGRYWFDYRTPQGELKRLEMPSSKAHNQLLDVLLSVGIVGCIPFFVLIAIGLYCLSQSTMHIMTPIAVAYLAFTLLWYDCAQYSYWLWWLISLADLPEQTATYSNSGHRQSSQTQD